MDSVHEKQGFEDDSNFREKPNMLYKATERKKLASLYKKCVLLEVIKYL